MNLCSNKLEIIKLRTTESHLSMKIQNNLPQIKLTSEKWKRCKYSTVPNKRGVQIVQGGKNFENLISTGYKQAEGMGELRNPLLKMKCKFVLIVSY